VLRFLRVAIPCVASVVSLLSAQDAKPQARGASSGPLNRQSSHGNVQGIPGSWGIRCAYALFSDPGRTDASSHFDAPTWPPFRQRRRLQARGNFGAQSHGFGTCCLRFVRWVSPPGRKTRFWVLAKLSQAGLITRRIPTRGFNGFLHHLPLSQASPGAMPVPFDFSIP